MKMFWTKIIVSTVLFFLCGAAPSLGDAMADPSGGSLFYVRASASPETSGGPPEITPVGVGPIATGGNEMTLSVMLDPFENPVNLYLAIMLLDPYYAIYLVNSQGELKDVNEGLVPWRSNSNESMDETIFENIPTSGLPACDYRVYLIAAPVGTSAGALTDYYAWETDFTNRDPGGAGWEYEFFIDFFVRESVQLSCAYPCSTTIVPLIHLRMEGGFDFQGNNVSGRGTVTVKNTDPCTIVEQDGGGAGASCAVEDSTNGSFTIDGYSTGVVSVTGEGFQTKVNLTFTEETPLDLNVTYAWQNPATGAITRQPVAYYAGAFKRILELSGLYGAPFEIPAVVCDGWMTETLEAAISRTFEGSYLFPPAPGITRTMDGEGSLYFYKSPFHIDGL